MRRRRQTVVAGPANQAMKVKLLHAGRAKAFRSNAQLLLFPSLDASGLGVQVAICVRNKPKNGSSVSLLNDASLRRKMVSNTFSYFPGICNSGLEQQQFQFEHCRSNSKGSNPDIIKTQTPALSLKTPNSFHNFH